MADSVWQLTVADLLRKAASADPTPGGGAVAAVAGALGVGLMQMATAVTGGPELQGLASRLAALQSIIVPAADADAEDFSAVMSAYRMPRGDDAERAARSRELERTGIAATEGPLRLVASFIEALEISVELEPLVKPSIVSDVLAGRDLVRGAARAEVRTADINLDQLVRLSSPTVAQLRTGRDALVATLDRLP